VKKLVYVAHPYGGLKANKEKIDKIMTELVFGDTKHDYVSPIHNYGFAYLTGEEYQRGLEVCLGLLVHCDVLVVCEGWETSKGCLGEVLVAVGNDIPIVTLDTWKQKVLKEDKNIYPDCIVPQE